MDDVIDVDDPIEVGVRAEVGRVERQHDCHEVVDVDDLVAVHVRGAGQAFEQYDDLRSKDLRFSQGFGIRAVSEEKHTFSLQVGFGKEGTEASMSFGKEF